MPSLKMKTKSTTGCLKEKNGLQVCRKSSMISKNPLPHARVSQDAEEIFVQNIQDAPVYDHDTGGGEANPDELSTEEKHFQKQPLRVTESATENMASLSYYFGTPNNLSFDFVETKIPTCYHEKLRIYSVYNSVLSDVVSNIFRNLPYPPAHQTWIQSFLPSWSRWVSALMKFDVFWSFTLPKVSVGLSTSPAFCIVGDDKLYVPQLDSEDSDDSSINSCKYQACNVSDFYISDMIFSALPVGSNAECDNRTDTVFLPDYQLEESSLLCDLTEEYMVFPFLEEDSLDSGRDHGDRSWKETNTDADSSSLYMAIHQLRSYDQDSHTNSYPVQDYECLDPQMYIRNFVDQRDMSFSVLPTPVPNNKQSTKQITLVLDLDETLVHSTLDHCDDADFTFPVIFDAKERTVYVRQRPHLMRFLERVTEMFEIVVFTASQSIYAKQLLDILDPDGKVISRRAYRESCTISEGCYMKDLTILGVDLAKVAIIDNSPQVFSLQVNNGIPVKSWFNDPSDTALISLLPFLESLVNADDVRPIIAREFGNKE